MTPAQNSTERKTLAFRGLARVAAYCAERKAPRKRTTTAQQKSVRLMAVNLTLFFVLLVLNTYKLAFYNDTLTKNVDDV
ncbi:hypothetical protein FC756_15775 [Lysinibacillus mangiferihumi]|uniref:Uncharacterized protein n=1 Tax=Lysinibacillus mangiferihumi TaxID=1130819 RepID=A0A4U2YZU1_9BACI|nr:hypothetical protein [Lysinibacillus mangiferihumi]TKI65831.1 hypothetical protein FC756_15775 [Lysinibacillus mangiferihumi]